MTNTTKPKENRQEYLLFDSSLTGTTKEKLNHHDVLQNSGSPKTAKTIFKDYKIFLVSN